MLRAFLGWAGALALVLAFTPAAAEPPPLAAYGALPAIENIAISDSGAKIALVTVAGEERRLVMQGVTGEPIGVIAIGDSKVRDVKWAGDEHLIIVTSQTAALPQYGIPEREWIIAQSYSLEKKRIINVAGQVTDSLNTIFSDPFLRRIDGRWYAFIMTVHVIDPLAHLQRVSLDDGATAVVEKMPIAQAEDWLVDAAGTPQARSRYDQARGYWSLGVRRGAIWPDIYQVEAPIGSPGLVGFGRDGHSILVRESVDDGARFVTVSPETGEVRTALPQDRLYESVILDQNQRLIGANWFDGADHSFFFDPADQAAWEAMLRAFKGQRVGLSAWSADRQKVVVHVDGPQNSGVYYLVDRAAKRADILGETYPGVPGPQVAEMKPYSYKAADGLEIPGYLTLPPGREAKNLPLVVLAHRGAQSHDSPGFDWWAQAIASRGYAVLQANFRGSSGYGQAYTEAGYGEWGRKMQTDLSDGVQALAAAGIVDPERACIVGASHYGGYAAMAGVTVQQGVYRCAVAVAGVSDLRELLKRRSLRAGRKTEYMRYWRRFMGAQTDNDPTLDAISPLRLAARADGPVLLIHGKDDTVVPFQQSSKLADALLKAGKPVEMVTLKAEDHWLSRERTRQQMLESTVGFLLKNNPPQSP